MNPEKKWVGGANVGWVNASSPFAILTASTERLTLNTIVLGKYVFLPTEVLSLQEYNSILGRGVQIVHNRREYPQRVIFWSLGRRPSVVLDGLRESGFVPQGNPRSGQPEGDFAIRWQAVLFFIIFWNAFFVADILSGGRAGRPGSLSAVPIVATFLASVLVWRVRLVRTAIISPGHSPSEITPLLHLFALISGVMTLALAVEAFTG